MKTNGIQTSIRKWGNSQGIRIPKIILKKANMKEGDKVLLVSDGDRIIIQKKKRFKSLTERIESFYGKPLNEISPFQDDEVDCGDPCGDERV